MSYFLAIRIKLHQNARWCWEINIGHIFNWYIEHLHQYLIWAPNSEKHTRNTLVELISVTINSTVRTAFVTKLSMSTLISITDPPHNVHLYTLWRTHYISNSKLSSLATSRCPEMSAAINKVSQVGVSSNINQ